MEKEVEPKRDEKGYPLLSNGDVDWELAGIEKQQVLEAYDRSAYRDKPKKKKPTNYTPPKKKRKKR